MLNILFIFGPDLSNKLNLPYAYSMSVINMGKTFLRLEGFSYLNYFAYTTPSYHQCYHREIPENNPQFYHPEK